MRPQHFWDILLTHEVTNKRIRLYNLLSSAHDYNNTLYNVCTQTCDTTCKMTAEKLVDTAKNWTNPTSFLSGVMSMKPIAKDASFVASVAEAWPAFHITQLVSAIRIMPFSSERAKYNCTLAICRRPSYRRFVKVWRQPNLTPPS